MIVVNKPEILDLSSKVLKGRNDYLFLTNDSNKVCEQITASKVFSEKQLRRWKLLLEMRELWLRNHNIKYYYFVVPNKHCIYSEYLPDNLQVSESRCIFQLTKYLSETSFVRIIYPYNDLLKAKCQRSVYRKGDTHWNYFGSYIGYCDLVCEISKSIPIHTIPLSEINFHEELISNPEQFDLGNKVGWTEDQTISYKLSKKKASIIESNGCKGTGNLYVYENTQNQFPRAMLFGDSCAHYIAPYLAESFSRLVVVQQPNLDYKLIEAENPDVVISQQVERFIVKIPDDLMEPTNSEIVMTKLSNKDLTVKNTNSEMSKNTNSEGKTLYINASDKGHSNSIAIKLSNPDSSISSADLLPIPPKELMEYGEPSQAHLNQGKKIVDKMRNIVNQAGYELEDCQRILEFGCANGRLIRWLFDLAKTSEIWGVDIQADKIFWAIENLSPPFNFAVNTTVPHLPFPDRYFDFVFAGSIFTHINELHIAWLLELSRVLSPKGLLYITVNDEHALETLNNKPEIAAGNRLRNHPLGNNILNGQYDYASVLPNRQGTMSLVTMNSDYIKRITRGFLKLISVTPNAYARVQSAYLFSPNDSY